MIAGSALYWPLLLRNGLFYSLSGHEAAASEASLWYSVFLVCVAVVAIAFACFQKAVSRYLDNAGSAPLFVTGGFFLVKSFECLVGPTGVLATAVAAVGVILYAVSFVLLTAVWAEWSTSLGRRDCAPTVAVSFALGFAASNVPLAAQIYFPAFGAVVTAFLPMVSAMLWFCGMSGPRPARREGWPEGESLVPQGRSALGLLAVLAVFLVMGGVVRGLGGRGLTSAPELPLVQDLVFLAFVALVFIGCLIARSRRAFWAVAASTAAIAFFAGLFILYGSGTFGFAGGWQTVISARTGLVVLYWIVLSDFSSSRKSQAVGLFSTAFVLVDVLSSFLGYLVVPNFLASVGAPRNDVLPALSGIGAFVLVVVTTVFVVYLSYGDRRAGVPVGGKAGGEASRRRDTPDWEPFGLTEREREVASLLAAGNSQKKIAATLGISLGTVQGNVREVYCKTGVHSRQALIDLMNEVKPRR